MHLIEREETDMLSKVNHLEKQMQQALDYPQAECPIWNHFSPGLYARTMLIRRGTVLTGAVHRTEHLCIISGVIEVITDTGVELIGHQHHVMKSMPGTKRAGYALVDTYWTTVHATTTTDLDDLVKELTFSKNSELLGGPENKQLLNNFLRGK